MTYEEFNTEQRALAIAVGDDLASRNATGKEIASAVFWFIGRYYKVLWQMTRAKLA